MGDLPNGRWAFCRTIVGRVADVAAGLTGHQAVASPAFNGSWRRCGTHDDLDDLDPDLISIHPLPSWVWYQDMEEFARGITDDRAGRGLVRAIQGRGAFRRFKDKLNEEYPNLLPAWYAFSEARGLHRAVEWLAEEELIDQASADRYRADHPEPDLSLRNVTTQPVASDATGWCRIALRRGAAD